MPSVATPEYAVKIENPTPALPPISERTPAMVMSAIECWEYWQDIKRVAYKEYGIEPEKFDALLPEYQRFQALVMLGYSRVNMFSFDVDKIWHAHVLCSHLWADFCLRLHGRIINHVAQIPDAGVQCTVCKSCPGCSIKCESGSSLIGQPLETADAFVSAYTRSFGKRPPEVWNLSAEADACAAD